MPADLFSELPFTDEAADPGPVPEDPTPDPEPARPGTGLAVLGRTDLLRLDDPGALAAVLRELRAGLEARVDEVMGEARERRVATGGKPSASDLLHELRAASAAHDVVDGVARVLTDVRRGIDERAVEAVQDHLGAGRKSAKVMDAHGGEITVTVEARTETSVSEDTVLDILGTHLITRYAAEPSRDPVHVGGYAQGVRHGIDELRVLLGASLPWKTTALTQLGKDLEAANEPALASRLGAAWARVAKGDPVAKLTVKTATPPPAAAAGEATPMPAGPES